MNFGELVAQIRDEINVEPRISEARVKSAINAAIHHYRGDHFEFNERFQKATVPAGTSRFQPPDGFLDVTTMELIHDGSSTVLDQYPVPQLVEWSDPDHFAMPWGFGVHDGNILLVPTPDRDYVLHLRYLYEYPDLVDDADTNPWLVQGLHLIKYRAKADIFRDYLSAWDAAAQFDIRAGAEEARLKATATDYISSGRIRQHRI